MLPAPDRRAAAGGRRPERAADGGGLVVAADRRDRRAATCCCCAAAYVAVVVVPVIVALLLAALLQPGAACAGAARLAAVAGRGRRMLRRRARRGLRDHHAGRRAVRRRLHRPRRAGQRGHRTRCRRSSSRTFPITAGPARRTRRRPSAQDDAGRTTRTRSPSGALTTAATVGEVFAGIVLALFTLFFFLKDGRVDLAVARRPVPASTPRAYIDEAARRSWRTLISYVRATVAVAAGRRGRHRHRAGGPRRAAGDPAVRAGLPRRVHPDHRVVPGRHGRGAGGAGRPRARSRR